MVLPLFLLMTPLVYDRCAVTSMSPCCRLQQDLDSVDQRAAASATTFNTMKSSVMLFSGKRGRKSHLCTSSAMVLGKATVEQSERTQHLGVILDNSAILDSPRRQLNLPSELQGIQAETIGLSLWKQRFCKASLHKSCSAGTGVRWTRLGLLHPGRLSAS